MASNANAAQRYNFYQTPIPATETLVLTPWAVTAAATTRATSLLGVSADLLQGGQYDGVVFKLTMAGRVFASASENITVAAYIDDNVNTNLTTFSGGDVKVLNTGTMATGGAAWISFYQTALCMWHATSTTVGGATTGAFIFAPEPGGFKGIPTTSAVLAATAVVGNSGTPLATTLANMKFYITSLTGTADSTSVLYASLQIETII